jgi:hypothetical protein
MDLASANLCIALEHARAGIPVFPAFVIRCFHTWRKKPCIGGWRDEATTDEAKIRSLWKRYPTAVPGIELGRAGLVVIDPDHHGNGPNGMEAFAQLCADIGGILHHPTTNTPQGHHHIFRQNGGEPIGNGTGNLPPGIDVRGAGGWIVAPGSVRPDGVRYTPREGTPPLPEAYRAGTIPPLPRMIDALIREPSYRPRGRRAGSEFIAASGHPVDVEAELAAMEYEGKARNGINATVCRVIPSLLRKGEHPDDVLERIVTTIMVMAERCGLRWSGTLETKSTVRRILSAYHNLLARDYGPTADGVPAWLPGDFHVAWLARTAVGARPTFGYNRGGFYIRRAQGTAAPERLQEKPANKPAAAEEPKKYRFPLLRFGQMRPGTEPDYLVDELIPTAGLVVVYGAPKSGKSFWVLDLTLHITLAWEYRDRSVQQGAVVYCAFEGAHGYRKRCEAFRRHHCFTDEDPPLYIVPGRADLIKDHGALVRDLREQLAAASDVPVKCVVLDTLNKSLIGSESKDVDMANYIAAAEHIQTEFNCVVIIVHHHGIDETRPRGHTSLRGAVAAQIKITRDEQNTIIAEIEDMRDGPEGAQIASRLVVVDVGTDRAGKPLTSAAVEPVDPGVGAGGRKLPKLTKNQKTFFSILQSAPNGLASAEWFEQARQAGLGTKRHADLHDLRTSLKNRGLVLQVENKWFVATEYRNRTY